MIKEYDNMNSIEILNYYRNCHYADGSNTESGILANALNEILPELISLRAAMEAVNMRIPSLLKNIESEDTASCKCLYCINSKIANGSDSLLVCYNHPLNMGERTLVHLEHSCPNFLPEKN